MKKKKEIEDRPRNGEVCLRAGIIRLRAYFSLCVCFFFVESRDEIGYKTNVDRNSKLAPYNISFFFFFSNLFFFFF